MTETILVIGGTGAMGRAVVRALIAHGSWRVRVFTRDPESASARTLRKAAPDRIEFATGDLDNPDSLDVAMHDVYGVFCNTDFWSPGVQSVAREREQGLRALSVAERANVRHFIYSSLDAASHLSGGALPLPHYDAKAAVEHDIDWRRSDEFMRQAEDGWYSRHVSVLVNAPYFETFQSNFRPEPGILTDGRRGLVFRWPLTGDAPWQMVALDDIGSFAQHVFANPTAWGGRTLRIGSDELTMRQVVETFTQVTGIAAEYDPISDDEFLNSGRPHAHDVFNNFAFYREGFAAPRDYRRLRQIHPGLRTFEAWLRETGWRGERREVHKASITG